ncbi:MAG: hypothetical protein M1840_000570 [Geoglossum simile]|nr:MAG: hypothetical protein M1840_000570 [Geoglossum simile]
MDTCPLCGIPNKVNFILKPYTAGPRCLSIDGGNLQDILSLKILESELKLPMPLREYFDIGIGSGLGALLVLQIFCKEQSIGDCLDRFRATNTFDIADKTLASRFSQDSASDNYQGNKYFPSRLYSHWREALLPGKHRSSTINSDLKAIFGKEETLFECSGNGKKIAIAATRSKDSSICVFSNYNRPEMSPGGHTLIRPEKLKDEMLIWHIGRAAISDPLSQKPFHGYYGKGIGDHKDLTNLTLWEQDSIWSRAKKPPDIFICLGTRIKDEKPAIKHPCQWFSDHRLQYDAKDIIELSSDGLSSSLFYLELIGIPLVNNDGFFCRAQIRCRLTPSQPAFMALIEWLRKAKTYFHYDHKTVPCVNRQLYEEARRGVAFSRYIEFSLVSLSDEIDVQIDGITKASRSISNCPYRLRNLIEDQGLNCVFGHRDHKRRYLEV